MNNIPLLPTQYSELDYLRMLAVGVNLSVAPPRQMETNGKAFNKKTGNVTKRIVQNIGTAPIYFWIQTEAPLQYDGDPLVSPPHGVITPDTGDKAGYGGQVDFSNYENAIWLGNNASNFDCLIIEAFNGAPHGLTDEVS